MKLNKKYDKTDWGFQIYFFNKDYSIRFALYGYNDDNTTLYFSNLFIDKKYRNKGYGNKILEAVFKYTEIKKYKSLILNVIKNSWMEKWYKSKGFYYLEDCKQKEYNGNIWLKKDFEQ